jgi:hypothetical protein
MNSGFQTLHEETIYNKCIYALITIMQSRLLALATENDKNRNLVLCDKFVDHFKKIYRKMSALDMVKKNDPRFSLSVGTLAKLIGFESNTKDLLPDDANQTLTQKVVSPNNRDKRRDLTP